MISVLCERDVAVIDWEKLEEVSEELKSGKRIWNSAWLD